MPSEQILGVPVDVVTRESVLSAIEQEIEQRGRGGYIVAINPEKVMAAQEQEDVRRALEQAFLRIPDGIGVLWASRHLGGTIRSRVTGADLFEDVCALAAKRHWPVFLLGSRPGVAEEASGHLVQRFPGFVVAGAMHGYVKEEGWPEVLETIRGSGARLLFVAMGSPRQEKWLNRHFDATGATIGFGIGGSLDALTGKVRRAPRWAQQAGLEWLWRLILQPSRIGRQMALPRFAWRVLRDKS